jgi:hypothetical protein
MKAIAVVLTFAIASIAISASYNSAYASRMNGKGGWCSEGTNCMSGRAKMAIKKSHTAKPQ